jgi:hypothetical protein
VSKLCNDSVGSSGRSFPGEEVELEFFVHVEVGCTMDSEVEREAALFVDRFV